MACAVKADGRLTCFGLATNDFFAPQFRSRIPVGTFVDVDVADELNGGAASRAAVCATDATGLTKCWGIDGTYNTGNLRSVAANLYGTCGITESGAVYCPMADSTLHPPTDPGPYVDLDISNVHLFAVREDGSLFTWAEYDALPAGKYVQVSAGGDSACAVRDDGTLGCNNRILVPEGLASARFTRVAVEYYQRVCGILRDGRIACFSARSDIESFEPPEGAFVRITAASSGMCAIRRDGSLVCWGDNPLAPPDGW